jgi:protein required for attachment to host cells
MLAHNALVVVADGHSARFFRNTAKVGVELDPAGHLTPRRLAEEGASGAQPEDMSPRDQDEATFAKQLAQRLNQMALARDFDEVVIIADPTTLGQMRHSYHAELKQRITRELAKRLNDASTDQIAAALD